MSQSIGQIIRKTFFSLRNRNFRLYFFAQLISNTGNWLTNVALTLLVLKITNSGLAVGLLAACQYGPILFLSAWAGAIADRLDKRLALLLTQSLEMAQSIGLAIMAFAPHPSVTGLFILAVAGGIFLAFDNPLRRSFVTEMVPKEDIPNAVVLYSTIVNTSRIFGPALAGLLAVTLGFGWCFTIDAASYIAVLIGLFMMRPKELYLASKSEGAKGTVAQGISYIFSQPTLWIGFIMLAAIGTLSYNFSVTLPLFVIKALHRTNTAFTVLYSIFSLGAVACGMLLAHRGWVRLRHLVIGAAGMGLAMLLFAISPNVIFAAPAIFLVGAASILYMTSTTTIVQVEAKSGMHGRILALQTVFLVGTSVIGGPLCGWLSDALGARSPIIMGGLVCLVTAIFGYSAAKIKAPSNF